MKTIFSGVVGLIVPGGFGSWTEGKDQSQSYINLSVRSFFPFFFPHQPVLHIGTNFNVDLVVPDKEGILTIILF